MPAPGVQDAPVVLAILTPRLLRRHARWPRVTENVLYVAYPLSESDVPMSRLGRLPQAVRNNLLTVPIQVNETAAFPP